MNPNKMGTEKMGMVVRNYQNHDLFTAWYGKLPRKKKHAEPARPAQPVIKHQSKPTPAQEPPIS